MLAEIGTSQFLHWMAMNSIDPFTEERADLRSAIVAHTQYMMHRGKGRQLKIGDFMPFAEDTSKITDVDQMAEAMLMLAKASEQGANK